MNNEYKMIQAIPSLLLYGIIWGVIGFCGNFHYKKIINKNI